MAASMGEKQTAFQGRASFARTSISNAGNRGESLKPIFLLPFSMLMSLFKKHSGIRGTKAILWWVWLGCKCGLRMKLGERFILRGVMHGVRQESPDTMVTASSGEGDSRVRSDSLPRSNVLEILIMGASCCWKENMVETLVMVLSSLQSKSTSLDYEPNNWSNDFCWRSGTKTTGGGDVIRDSRPRPTYKNKGPVILNIEK